MPDAPTISDIRSKTVQVFGIQPCLWQAKVVQAVLQHDRDVISIAGTGMGKTLTFWMPLLFCPAQSVQIIVTPLNLLGKQNVASLKKAGYNGIFIGKDTATLDNFRAIENLQYQAIIVTPEQLMKDRGGFERLFQNQCFASRIISIIFDEAHCVSSWGSFRPEYTEVGRLRDVLPKDIPIMITSATLPTHILNEVRDILRIRTTNLAIFRQSVKRPNIFLGVQKIQSSLSKFEDLKFVLNNRQPGDTPPPKFLIFFDDINESIAACESLRGRVPPANRDKINWFNSDMSDEFKEEEAERLLKGDSWGLCTTDSFGMGMDLPDIGLVVQWRATCTLTTLWQRMGRAARNQSLTAKAVFLVEKEHFDDERKRRADRAKVKEARKRRPLSHISINAPSTSEETLEPVVEAMDSESDSEPDDIGNQVAELRAKYTFSSSSVFRSSRSKKKVELETAMDDLINAKKRGYTCRKLMLEATFAGDEISTYGSSIRFP
ncbi:hypothetical protein M378DRAFT_91381 [Amanita muscaria Koide BX008]|uniref:DNA 3'-5' helicase n=1 Tax=Amanita muscaria (strain Koide BX008) TaxID=946122 RepID=A0A0C2WEW2_AMAMK|nr:hypothetical protein M378DRAFT_91381 [Amanita muscaria Koide BX008]